jgi:hypothetical protein
MSEQDIQEIVQSRGLLPSSLGAASSKYAEAAYVQQHHDTDSSRNELSSSKEFIPYAERLVNRFKVTSSMDKDGSSMSSTPAAIESQQQSSVLSSVSSQDLDPLGPYLIDLVTPTTTSSTPIDRSASDRFLRQESIKISQESMYQSLSIDECKLEAERFAELIQIEDVFCCCCFCCFHSPSLSHSVRLCNDANADKESRLYSDACSKYLLALDCLQCGIAKSIERNASDECPFVAQYVTALDSLHSVGGNVLNWNDTFKIIVELDQSEFTVKSNRLRVFANKFQEAARKIGEKSECKTMEKERKKENREREREKKKKKKKTKKDSKTCMLFVLQSFPK